MHRRRRGGRLLRAPAPDGGVPGQRLLPPGIRSSPISPGGVLYPCTGFATNFAGEGGEGDGRLPSTVPGGRARGARDGARPETSSAGGAERGGGHRRSYSRFARGSQLGPAPRSLSLTCLTPPQPGPAPCHRLSVPAPAAPPPPGAHVTDDTAPLGRPGFLIGFPQGAYRPSTPPSQVPAPPPVSQGAGLGIIRPQKPPAACPAAALPP